MEIRREASGRAYTRGLLLLVVLFCAGVSFSQTPDVLARLRHELNGSSEEKRSALFEIRNLRSPAASTLAIGALSDTDELVRATATGSVVFLPKGEAVRVLLPLLTDKAEFVRREAAFALGVVGDATAGTSLVRVMQTDKIMEVRTAAAVALGIAGDLGSVEGLLKVLRTKPREDDEFLRRSAARSIGQIAQREVAGKSQDVTPQNFLPDKFKDVGPQGVPTPAGFASAIDVLVNVVRNSSEADDTRREAAFALGAIGDAKAVATLRSFTSSSDPYLAEIAREALLMIEQRNKAAVSGNK